MPADPGGPAGSRWVLWHQYGGSHVAISRRASHFHFKYATCLVSSHISGIYPPLLVAILFLILKTPSPLAIHFYLLLCGFSVFAMGLFVS